MTYKKGPEGKVPRPMDRGAGDTLTATIDSAELIAGNRVRAEFRNDDPSRGESNGKIAIVVLIVEKGRFRTLQSEDKSGKMNIKDGTVLSTGNPIPWLGECSGPRPKAAPTAAQ